MHTIKFVALHSGLSQHTIRAWERRYAALSPERTAANRRLYTASDLEKLSLLNRALQAGHSIGQVAGLSISELQRMLPDAEPPQAEGLRQAPASAHAVPQSAPDLEECLRCVERLDARGLEDALTRAAALMGMASFIDRLLQPLLQSIGERWRAGELRPANEHLATAIVRTFLGRMLDSFQPTAQAPRLIVTTPAGQMHELGALVVAVTAASAGWRVLYLGPNLPAEEIAGAAHQSGARAVALSIAYPPDDPRMQQEMTGLRKYIGQEIPILAGGRAAAAYQATLDSIAAIQVPDIQILRAELDALRSR